MKWAVGVTTVPERWHDLLPRTLRSLWAAGFSPDEPDCGIRLFLDGSSRPEVDDTSHPAWSCGLTCRDGRMGAWANWWLGLVELHQRHPNADRFLMVQDDAVFCRNVRRLLERTTVDGTGTDHGNRRYWNLFTMSRNEQEIAGKPHGWVEASRILGSGNPGKQTGLGALALCFTVGGVEALLQSREAVTKPRSQRPRTNVDGTVVRCLNAAGFREFVHNPSLVDHAGKVSIIGANRDDPSGIHGPYPACISFPGETADAMRFCGG